MSNVIQNHTVLQDTSSYVIFKGTKTPYKPYNGIEITFPRQKSQGTTIRCNKVYTGSCNSDGSNTAKSTLSTPYRCKLYTRELWRWKRILTIGNNKLKRTHVALYERSCDSMFCPAEPGERLQFTAKWDTTGRERLRCHGEKIRKFG